MPVPTYSNDYKGDNMSIQPQGEDLRKAVKWVFEERKHNSERDIQQIVEEASAKFDLSPKDAAFLGRFVREDQS